MPRQKGKPAAAPNADLVANPSVASDTITAGEGWYTYRAAAAYLGFDGDRGVARLRTAVRTHPAFTAPGARKTLSIPDTDIPAIAYVSRAALDAYRATLGESGIARRGPRGDRRRALIDVPHAVRDQVAAALAEFGITLRDPAPSGKRKSKRADAASAETAESNGDASIGEPSAEPAAETVDA